MQLTPSQQEIIRTRPQQSRLYLSVFQPRTIMQCRVNDASIAKGARTITYDSVTLGAYTDVQPGMTLLIGTTIGGREVGKIRIRSATSSTFVVSENSNIDWQDNLYLTVLKYWEVWPVYPRIIQNPSNPEDVIFYKDYDIAYTNQNSILGTFVNAGPHRAAFLDGGLARLYWSSTGTYVLATGTTPSYYWEFEGGNPSTSTSANPGYVNYTGAGHFVTKLSISGSNGSSDVTYRYVSIYSRFENSSNNNPIKRWEISDIGESRGEGGLSATIKIYDNIQIDDNAVIVIFSEDWYGNTKQSFGGNYPNAEAISFVGYVERDSIQYDYRYSYIQFNIVSITGIMKDSIGFSVSTQSEVNPDTWYKIADLDVRRAIYHYLKWHTTVPMVSDIQFVGQDQKIQYFDADRTSMFDAIDNLMRGTLIGSMNADRQGKIWIEVDAQAYTNPTGSFTPVMDITKRDWMGQPTIEERVQDEVSYLEYGGIQYSGVVTGTFQALLACAPGDAPSFRGKTETLEGLALSGQVHLNQLVGNVFANKNSKYPTVRMDITENLKNLDIAPQEAVGIHINAEDTAKNVPLNILGLPIDIQWKYDHKNGLLTPSIIFANLVTGVAGDTITIPVPPDDGFKVPSLIIPPIPIFEFPMPSGTPTGSSSGMPYIDFSSAGNPIVGITYSRGAWGAVAVDSSGIWVTVLYTGLYLVTGKIRAFGGVLTTDTIDTFIAKRSGGGWGLNFKTASRPAIGTSSPPVANYVTDYDAELTAIVYLYESETIGIGMDTSKGGSSTNRRLQVARLDLG